MAGKWIDKVGIEVECGVKPSRGGASIEGFDRESDGSLRTNGADTTLREYVSNPHKYPQQLESLGESTEELYQIINEINESMGLHVHISFTNEKYYYRLASQKFQDFFIHRLKQTELWENNESLRKRVEGGENTVTSRDADYYCRELEKKQIDRQLKRTGEASLKYRRITFFKGKYDTVEFRLFSAMETAEEVMQAVEFTTETINAYMQNSEYTEKAAINAAKPEAEKTEENVDETIGDAGGKVYNV